MSHKICAKEQKKSVPHIRTPSPRYLMCLLLLSEMNKKLDKMDPKAGAALSHTDILLMSHIQIMLIDMLAGIQESAWVYEDKSGY